MGLNGKFGSSYSSSFLIQERNVIVSVCSQRYKNNELIYFNTIPINEVISHEAVQQIFRLKRTQHTLILPPSHYEISPINLPKDIDNITQEDLETLIQEQHETEIKGKQIDYTPIANQHKKAYGITANASHIHNLLNHFGPYKNYFDIVTTFDHACTGLYENLNIDLVNTLLILCGPTCSRAIWLSCNGVSKITPLPNLKKETNLNTAIADEITQTTEKNIQRFLDQQEKKRHRIIVAASDQDTETLLIKKLQKNTDTHIEKAKFSFLLPSIPQHPSPSDLATIGSSLFYATKHPIVRPINLLPQNIRKKSIMVFFDFFTLFRLFVAALISTSFIGMQAYTKHNTLQQLSSENNQAIAQLEQLHNDHQKHKEDIHAVAVASKQLIHTEKGFSEYFLALSQNISHGIWITNIVIQNNPLNIRVEGYSFEAKLASKFHSQLKKTDLFSQTQIVVEGSSKVKKKKTTSSTAAAAEPYTHFLIQSTSRKNR